MAESKLKVITEYADVVAAFEDIKKKTEQASSDAVDLGKTTKVAFDAMTKEAKEFGQALDKNGTQITGVKAAINQEVQVIKQLTLARKASNDPAQIAAYTKQIDAARTNIKKLAADENSREKNNEKEGRVQLGIIETLILKEKLLTEARNKSQNPELIKKYNDKLDETRKKIDDLTNAQKKQPDKGGGFLDGALSVFAGNLLTEAAGKVTQFFSDIVHEQEAFEKSLKNLSAITGASGKDLEFYGEQAVIMGRKIEGGATAAVEAYKLIGSAKPDLLKDKEALVEVTQAAVTLAQASGLTLPEAAQNLGNALNAFDADANQSTKFINVLAASAQLGAQEIPFVTEALSKFGGVAKAANISIEQSASAIEILGQKIPEAATVGTNLRNVITILQTEAAKQGRTFQGLGKELDLLAPKIKDVTYLEQTFGRENLLAATILIQNRTELEKMTVGVTGTSSAFEQAATNTDTFSQSVTEAGNAYKELTLAIGNGKLGHFLQLELEGATEALKDLAHLFNGTFLSEENILALTQFGKVTEEQARRLDRFGLSLSNLNKLSESEKTSANLLAATDLYIKQISTLELGQKVLQGFNGEVQKLGAQYKVGLISIDEYTLRLKILQSQIGKVIGINAKFSTKKVTDDLVAQAGIIEKLQKEIADLTEQRVKATSVKDINNLTGLIKQKQDELDALLGKENEKIKRAREEYERAIADLRKRVAQARLDLLTGDARIEAELKFNEEELDILKKHIIELGQAVNKGFKLTLEQQEQFNILRYALEKKAADDSIKLEIERQNKIIENKKKTDQQSLDQLGADQATETNAVEGTTKPKFLKNFEEVDFEKSKQEALLNIQEKYALKKLELKKAALAAEREEEIKALDLQLQLIGNADDKETQEARRSVMEKLEILEKDYQIQNQTIENETTKTVNDIKQKRDELAKQPAFSLSKMLGITDNDLQNIQSALSDIGSALDSYIQTEISGVDKEINASQQKQAQYSNELGDLKSQLQQQQELQQKGKANSVSVITQEIEAKQRQVTEEEKIQKDAIEKKKEYQKQQLIIDSIVQGSALVTSAANILSQATAEAGPYGVIIAGIAIGAMFAAFIAAKVSASKAINDGGGYAGGGYTGDGAKHEVAGTVHKAEFVTTKEHTAENKTLLMGIHQDDENMMKIGVMNLIKNKGIVLSPDLPEIIHDKKDSVRQADIINILKTDNGGMEKELGEIKNIMSEILKSSKDKVYTDHNGNLIIQSGNHKQIIRKK